MEYPEVNHANEAAASYFHLFITFDPMHIQPAVTCPQSEFTDKSKGA